MTARRERFLNIKEIFMAPNSGGLIDAENGLVSRRIFIEPEIYIEEVRFARDSPLEEAGFELFVSPGISASPSWWSRARSPHCVPNGVSPSRDQ